MSLKEYMELPYSMSIIPDTVEGGFTVIFPELPGCMTCGDTIEELLKWQWMQRNAGWKTQ